MVGRRVDSNSGIVDLFSLKLTRGCFAGWIAIFILMIPAYSAAQDSNLRQVTGRVFIKGETNDVVWDDDGISRWEAGGDVYMRFTSAEGDVVELWGDNLVYERRNAGGIPSHWASVEGNGRLKYDDYSVEAGKIMGLLNPLNLEVSSGVVFRTEGLEVSCSSLTLVETRATADRPFQYKINVPGEAEAIFERDTEVALLPREDASIAALPLPIKLDLDFTMLAVSAVGLELEFDEDGFIGAYFPNGGNAEADNGYNFSGSALYFDGWNEISAYNCSITGPDIEISALMMTFFPDMRNIKLEGEVTLISDEGVLMMDSLEISYDDNGVRRLSARGNVRIDLNLVIGEGILLDESAENGGQ